MKKIFTFLVAFLVVASGAVWGEIKTGSMWGLTVEGPEGSFVLDENYHNLLQIQGDGVTVSMAKGYTEADCKITINCTGDSKDDPVTVILDNIYLKTTQENATPISVEHGNDVTLIFKGYNKVESPDVHEKGDGTMAIIQGESNGS